MNWNDALRELPLIAILRGIRPSEAVAVATVLYDSGFRILEVPLNSPDALKSIESIRTALNGRALVGAGTVLSEADVQEARAAGAEIVVAPNTNAAVIHAARAADLTVLPGFFTPTEAFAALAAGATALKLFPAEVAGPAGLKAVLAVLPAGCLVFPVGGIEPGNMTSLRSAGAAGFGIGSSLFKPGQSPDSVSASAARFVKAWRSSAT